MAPSHLLYRGAMYRKAAPPVAAPYQAPPAAAPPPTATQPTPNPIPGKPVLDKKIFSAAWNALRPRVELLVKQLQKIVIDNVVKDANRELAEEFRRLGFQVGTELYADLIKELKAGTGGVDIATKKKAEAMAKALEAALTRGAITPAVVLDLFGWAAPKIKDIKYKNMDVYFDPTKQEGTAYIKAVLERLNPLL